MTLIERGKVNGRTLILQTGIWDPSSPFDSIIMVKGKPVDLIDVMQTSVKCAYCGGYIFTIVAILEVWQRNGENSHLIWNTPIEHCWLYRKTMVYYYFCFGHQFYGNIVLIKVTPEIPESSNKAKNESKRPRHTISQIIKQFNHFTYSTTIPPDEDCPSPDIYF